MLNQLVAFTLDAQQYALPLTSVQRVVRMVEITPLPKAPVQKLGESIAEASQAATQIAASSQQQMAGMDQVAQAMENIKTASTQNVASTKQTEVAAKNIGELGRKLEELVALYKVGERSMAAKAS